jgi:heme exporter protein CcmD
MNHWLFVAAAYGITLGATAALIGWSYFAMRAAERDPK